LIDDVEDLGIIKVGAEAVLRKVLWRGMYLVEKRRVPKPYRHPELDREVRTSRTVREARVMIRAKEAGVSCPAVIHVDLQNASIYMQYLEGSDLRPLLDSHSIIIPTLVRDIGASLARLHLSGIYHGDVVPSNLMVVGEQVAFIDFGLSGFSQDIEEHAVDLHLFERGVSASHPHIAPLVTRSLKEGYASVAGEERLSEVEAKIAEIRSRARYVERSGLAKAGRRSVAGGL
jgi:TP53 regulating kinase-like protein